MSEENDNKENEATTRQRERFAERGEVAQSKDLVLAAVFGFCILSLFAFGEFGVHKIMLLMKDMWTDMHEHSILTSVRSAFLLFSMIAFPILIGAVAISTLTVWGQAQEAFAASEFKFDLERLNPIPRFLNLFSFKQASANILFLLVKVAIVSFAMYVAIRDEWLSSIIHEKSSVQSVMFSSVHMIERLLKNAFYALLVIGLSDYGISKFKLEQKMKMSREELKEEAKEENGDPHIRSRRRRKMMELAKQRSTTSVPKATVVIVNPTHFAVAIQYVSGKMRAPKVVAKGSGVMAQKIRDIARKNGVPIISQPPLTRLIYKRVPVGKEIPEDLYKAVAVILAQVYRYKKGAA